MSKIREDLEGIVAVTVSPGEVMVLTAGDEVPEGVTLGEHVLEPDVADVNEGDDPAVVEDPAVVDDSTAGDEGHAPEADGTAPTVDKGPYAKTRARK